MNVRSRNVLSKKRDQLLLVSGDDDQRARRIERRRLRAVRAATQHTGHTEKLHRPAVHRQAGEAFNVFQTVLSKTGNREWLLYLRIIAIECLCVLTCVPLTVRVRLYVCRTPLTVSDFYES